MKVVLQIVEEASVEVEEKIIGQIKKGYLLLVGIFDGDTDNNVRKMVEKISKLRIFKDENGKTNLSLSTVGGSILSVSQFTLCADTEQGNRPSFVKSAKREEAIRMYDLFNDELRNKGFLVETGEFGAEMKVRLVNDGPFTLVLEN
jgi:D-tyrosyl-tRNA(Tyr) deacylase